MQIYKKLAEWDLQKVAKYMYTKLGCFSECKYYCPICCMCMLDIEQYQSNCINFSHKEYYKTNVDDEEAICISEYINMLGAEV